MSNQKNEVQNYQLGDENVVGNGTFGVVYQDKDPKTGEAVAIKKVFQDRRYKNRELQMMKEIGEHPNVIRLRQHYLNIGNDPEEVYLYLVMDYIPETLYRIIRYYGKKRRTPVPNILLKLYAYQLLRSLAYIHGINICHRDIKPTNVLVDPRTHQLKLCDFGSAKKLVPGEMNISYICSRYYRAPELMYGATQYNNSIDVWSTACVIAEMIIGEPIFAGQSSVEQLVEIIKILGTPNQQDLMDMNPEFDSQTPQPFIKPKKWKRVFKGFNADPQLIDLISHLLVFSPVKRLKPLESLLHPYFDEIKKQGCKINSQDIPELFQFMEEELRGANPNVVKHLVPQWNQNQQKQSNINMPKQK